MRQTTSACFEENKIIVFFSDFFMYLHEDTTKKAYKQVSNKIYKLRKQYSKAKFEIVLHDYHYYAILAPKEFQEVVDTWEMKTIIERIEEKLQALESEYSNLYNSYIKKQDKYQTLLKKIGKFI